MAIKSRSLENNKAIKTYIPEKFPLIKGMIGTKIEALQKELSLTEDGFLGLQVEDHLIHIGYMLPLSESDYNKIVKPQHIKIFEWIIKIIDQSSETFHLDGCLRLVELLKQKFKKDAKIKSEIENLTKILEDCIKKKKQRCI